MASSADVPVVARLVLWSPEADPDVVLCSSGLLGAPGSRTIGASSSSSVNRLAIRGAPARCTSCLSGVAVLSGVAPVDGGLSDV